MKWRTTMPKDVPDAGHSHVVVSVKGPRGRYELVAQLPTDEAQQVIQLAARLTKPAAHQATKEPT